METSEEELARRGAEGAARRLVQVADNSGREASVRLRIEGLLQRWSNRSERDRKTINQVW